MKWGWIAINPALNASPPKVRKHEITPPAIADAHDLLAAAMAHDPEFGALLQVLAATGTRRGEVCELRWSDIDQTTRRTNYLLDEYWRSTRWRSCCQSGRNRCTASSSVSRASRHGDDCIPAPEVRLSKSRTALQISSGSSLS